MINSVCGIKSTGRICTDLALELAKQGHTAKIAYGRGEAPAQYADISRKIGTNLDVAVHGCLARTFDASGYGSLIATKRFLDWVRRYDPDVIHLHNIHGYYIHVPLLFDYLKASGKRVIWTLHDCWPFTGHCCHYSFCGCNRWKTGCSHCPQKGRYPASILLDRSSRNYAVKKELFSGLDHLTLVTPSRWLADQVSDSFLGSYPVQVIPNGIDLSRFRYTPEPYSRDNLKGKKVVLGVASAWDDRKGLNTFLQIADRLGEAYQVVLVGVSPRQIRHMPGNVIGVAHTNSIEELAMWYSRADVFVNTSVEETMGMTTVEAAACGAPVVSFDATALPEVTESLGGCVVETGNIEGLCRAIRQACGSRTAGSSSCVSAYARSAMLEKYLNLYNLITKRDISL